MGRKNKEVVTEEEGLRRITTKEELIKGRGERRKEICKKSHSIFGVCRSFSDNGP